jgi:hypothetical protein
VRCAPAECRAVTSRPFLRGRQRFAGEQVAGGVVADRERIAIPLIPEEKLALVVRAPEAIRFGDRDERRAGPRGPAPPSPMGHQAVAIEHGVDGADGRAREVRPALVQPLPNLGRAPRRAVPFEAHDQGFDRCRQLIGVSIGSAASVTQAADIAGRSCSPSCERCQTPRTGPSSTPIEQPPHETRPLIHGVTLLPRHAPSC